MNYRPLRVGKLFRAELNAIIIREMELDGALVTITDIGVDKKLERADVGLSILPPGAADKTLAVFKAARGKLQHLLMEKVHIKPFPRIDFYIDHGYENAAAVEKNLLNNK